MLKITVLLPLICALSVTAKAEDAPLTKISGELFHPVVDGEFERLYQAGGKAGDATGGASDLFGALKHQTKVKSQGSRSLCTVFSTVGLIEALYLTDHPGVSSIDLSEEWVQYLVSQQSKSGGGNGARLDTVAGLIRANGIADEKALPYSGKRWSESSPEASKVCSGLSGINMKRCLSGHHRPDLLSLPEDQLAGVDSAMAGALKSAQGNRVSVTAGMSYRMVGSTSQIKGMLNQGIPLTLLVDVYYGSWNHGHGASLGIEIDESLFAQGVVNYPEKGSLDRALSLKELNRHSVVIVGYDDNVEVTYDKKMTDGSVRTFTRKGVYYFKNSWGTKKFGSKFRVGGKRIPGFGMIVQDHANEFGQFMAIQLGKGAEI